MLVRLPDLLALRIVVVLAKVETVDATGRLGNKGVGQRSGDRVVIALYDRGQPFIDSISTRNSTAGEWSSSSLQAMSS